MKNLQKPRQRKPKNTTNNIAKTNAKIAVNPQAGIEARFEKNMRALQEVNPTLFASLALCKANEKFEVFLGKDPVNINIYDKERKISVYMGEPLEETKKIFSEFAEQKHYKFHYFFGLGNGILYKMMLGNESIQRLYVFEPELEIIYICFHFVDFSEDIANKRIYIQWTNIIDKLELDLLLNDKGQWVYSRIYNLNIFNNYYGFYSAECLEISSIILRIFEHHIISVGNDSRDAILGIQHHVENLPTMIKTPSFLNFIKNVKNTKTAVIVSTGPSLYKQLPLLKEYAPYITIFCIDASFPILSAHGIKPDVVITLERVAESAKFYTETPQSAQDGVIFALTSIVDKAVLNAIKEENITFSMRPFGYTRFFDLKEYGYAGIGMSAANLAYEFVVHSKFKKCIFIGQDLAFSKDGKTHSKGAVYGEKEEQYKQQEDAASKIMVPAYGGNGLVETSRVWKMFLGFFERDIADTPYEISVINSTEGGARITGTKEQPFAEALKEIQKDFPSDEKGYKLPIKLEYPIESEIEQNHKIIEQKVCEFLEYGFAQKKRIEKLFLRTTKFLENIEILNKENKLETADFSLLDTLTDSIDDIKEMFKDETFIKAFSDAVQSYIVHQELEVAKIQVKPANSKIEFQAKQLEWLYAHRYWLFSLAGGMNATLEVFKNAAKKWMKIPAIYDKDDETYQRELADEMREEYGIEVAPDSRSSLGQLDSQLKEQSKAQTNGTYIDEDGVLRRKIKI